MDQKKLQALAINFALFGGSIIALMCAVTVHATAQQSCTAYQCTNPDDCATGCTCGFLAFIGTCISS